MRNQFVDTNAMYSRHLCQQIDYERSYPNMERAICSTILIGNIWICISIWNRIFKDLIFHERSTTRDDIIRKINEAIYSLNANKVVVENSEHFEHLL